MRSSREANCRAITWHMPPVPTCAGASASRRKHGCRTRRRWSFPGRSPSGGSCAGAWPKSALEDVEIEAGRSTSEREPTEGGDPMKYLCLVYGEEKSLAGMDDPPCVGHDEQKPASGPSP